MRKYAHRDEDGAGTPMGRHTCPTSGEQVSSEGRKEDNDLQEVTRDR